MTKDTSSNTINWQIELLYSRQAIAEATSSNNLLHYNSNNYSPTLQPITLYSKSKWQLGLNTKLCHSSLLSI